MKIIVTIIPKGLVTNSLLSSFCHFLQQGDFEQVDGLVSRNIPVFCFYRIALYFKAMPNSIDFYKGILLHVIPVCIIVPWKSSHKNTSY